MDILQPSNKYLDKLFQHKSVALVNRFHGVLKEEIIVRFNDHWDGLERCDVLFHNSNNHQTIEKNSWLGVNPSSLKVIVARSNASIFYEYLKHYSEFNNIKLVAPANCLVNFCLYSGMFALHNLLAFDIKSISMINFDFYVREQLHPIHSFHENINFLKELYGAYSDKIRLTKKQKEILGL